MTVKLLFVLTSFLLLPLLRIQKLLRSYVFVQMSTQYTSRWTQQKILFSIAAVKKKQMARNVNIDDTTISFDLELSGGTNHCMISRPSGSMIIRLPRACLQSL